MNRLVRYLVIALTVAVAGCGRHRAGSNIDASSSTDDARTDDGGGDDAGDRDGDGGTSGGDGGTSGGDGGTSGGDGGTSGGDGGGGDGGTTGPCTSAACASTYVGAVNGAGLGVAVDSQDNVYVVGLAESDITFGTHVHYKIGYRDAFIASFTPSGAYRWSKTFGVSTKITGSYGVVVDANDNVYMTGIAASGADFGGGPIYTASFGLGQFVASFSASGAHRWSRIDGGGGALGIATAGTRVFTIGRFQGTTAIGNISLTATGAEDVVVAAFETANGATSWARKLGTAATDYEGNIVAHDDWIAFSISLAQDEHLVSFTAAGGDRFDVALADALDMRGLAVDGAGNLYLAGRHRWGQDVVPGATPVNGDNVYIHAFTAAGASRWSWTLPESPARNVVGIPYTLVTIDQLGRPMLAGTFINKIFAGGAPLVNATQPARDDIFLATFGADGTPIAARHPVETTVSVYAHGTAVDSQGRTYVAGIYYGIVNFGDGPLPFASSGGPFLFRN